MCEYIILEDFIMDKYIYDNSNGLWYDYREIITSPVWYYLPKKKKGISEYGDSGICGISVSIEKCSTSSC